MYISVNGKTLYYEFINGDLLSGSQPLMVFLHEGLGSCRQWKDFPQLLADKVNCPALLYDRYGYGRSESFALPRDCNYMHEEALQFLPGLLKNLCFEKRPLILIGHSDGGSIAVIYAGSFPENVKGVITEAAHLFIEDISVTGIQQAIADFEKGRLKQLLKRYHGNNTFNMFHGWADTWTKDEMKRWNIEKYLRNINAPFLAIQGENDQYGTFEQLGSVQKNVASKTDILLIPDCAHIPHQQAEYTVLQKMSDFIIKDVL